MPEKGKNPNRRFLIDSQKKLHSETGSLQGGQVESIDNGVYTVRLTNGGRLSNSNPFAIGSLGLGEQVNPTISSVPAHDFAPSTPIGVVLPVLQDQNATEIVDIGGEVKVLYTHTIGSDLKVMLGGHVSPPIEIATLPSTATIFQSRLESTGPGVTDYIIDLRVANSPNREVYTFYGNSSDGTSWSLSELDSLDQRPVSRLQARGSGYWDGGIVIPPYATLNNYTVPQETVASVIEIIPSYTETTVQVPGTQADPEISYTELKTNPDDDFFDDFSGSTWKFDGLNLVDTRIEQTRFNFDSGTGRYQNVRWKERDKRTYSTDVASISAYQGALRVETGSFFFGWDIVTTDLNFTFDTAFQESDGISRYTITSIGSPLINEPERFEWSVNHRVAPGFNQTNSFMQEPTEAWDGVPYLLGTNPRQLSYSVGDNRSANDMTESTPDKLPLGIRQYSRRLFTRFARERANSFTSGPIALFSRASIVYYSETELTNDPVTDTQVGPRFGYYIGGGINDTPVNTRKIKTPSFGSKATSYIPDAQQTAIEVASGLEFYQVTSSLSSAFGGDITVDVRKDVVLNGATFTQDTGATETTQRNVLQLLRSDGSTGSVNVLQSKFYPSP